MGVLRLVFSNGLRRGWGEIFGFFVWVVGVSGLFRYVDNVVNDGVVFVF